MHDMPDTEDADADSERYWPEGYKDILWAKLIPAFATLLLEARAFETIYTQSFGEDFSTYEQFVDRLAEMVTIGAENGSDKSFDEVYAAFRKDAPLPNPRSYATHFWPDPIDEELRRELHGSVLEEYRDLHAYIHIHEDHYDGALSFDAFLDKIAALVVSGAVKGADDAIGDIYSAFLGPTRLPIARRRPRRAR
jgi:hypothetical protein